MGCNGFGKRLLWYRNPGKAAGLWKEQVIESGFFVEFAFLVDLDNDGKAREILPNYLDKEAPLAWYEPKDGAFVRHVVSERSYGHGIGAGDVNGDGRNDVITPQGWFEAPPDPRSGPWTFHQDFKLGTTGFIHAIDINGDRRNDLVTSLAHNYGILWFEQGEAKQWMRRVIDDSWSQAHAVTLVDINADGQKDRATWRTTGETPASGSRSVSTGTNTGRPRTGRSSGSSTSSTTAPVPAEACKFQWRISTATATWTLR